MRSGSQLKGSRFHILIVIHTLSILYPMKQSHDGQKKPSKNILQATGSYASSIRIITAFLESFYRSLFTKHCQHFPDLLIYLKPFSLFDKSVRRFFQSFVFILFFCLSQIHRHSLSCESSTRCNVPEYLANVYAKIMSTICRDLLNHLV